MKPLRRAAARLRDAGSIPVLAALLALAVSAPLAAGEQSRPHDSSDQGRSAQPRSDSGSQPSTPSYSPPPSSGNSGSGSSSGQGPRVAVPRSDSGDSSRQQRPRTGSRDDGRGGYHGGGYYGGNYGGYYGGYYSPYHRYYWGPYWGWGWWGWWPGDDYYGYWGYNYPRYYGDRYDRYGRETGALDVDVSPGKTEVWIDGRYVGTADDFDGFPQYLWLDKGVYDLVLYREGYTTIARQITIYAGSVISIDDRMQRGDSVKPQDLVTKTHERRDERVRTEEERREEIAQRDRDNMEDWRERARRRIEERDRYDRNDQDRRAAADDTDGSAHLRVEILPSDASVYLDGKFVGTGAVLERLRQGLRVEPGEHRIAVVRPGHKAEEQEFTVAPGEDVDLEIELESME